MINKPSPLIRIIIGVLILRPLKGRGLLIMGFQYGRGVGAMIRRVEGELRATRKKNRVQECLG